MKFDEMVKMYLEEFTTPAANKNKFSPNAVTGGNTWFKGEPPAYGLDRSVSQEPIKDMFPQTKGKIKLKNRKKS